MAVEPHAFVQGAIVCVDEVLYENAKRCRYYLLDTEVSACICQRGTHIYKYVLSTLIHRNKRSIGGLNGGI